MNRSVRLLLIAALMAAASALPASSHADRRFPATPTATGVSGPVEERWWGGVAAMACGFGIRYWPAFGWNVGYNALLVVSCLAMGLDAID